MRIATWNINSVRLRIGIVADLLRQESPDVLCLQETKVINDLFPGNALRELGYVHQAINGQKGYHGVAILSRLPFRRTDAQNFCGKNDTRHVSAVFENGLELHNFYVPAGGDIPDPDANPKFAHKLAFLRELGQYFESRRDRSSAPVVLVGDLNVAPQEHDVWSHRQMLGVVSHTPVETNLLNEAMTAFEWTDVTRQFVPEHEKIYSWWSYRALDWTISNRGRRLDHLWVSKSLKGAVTSHAILKEARGWTQPSDHVPVIADIET